LQAVRRFKPESKFMVKLGQELADFGQASCRDLAMHLTPGSRIERGYLSSAKYRHYIREQSYCAWSCARLKSSNIVFPKLQA
jgi:hypothetical protein